MVFRIHISEGYDQLIVLRVRLSYYVFSASGAHRRALGNHKCFKTMMSIT